MHVQVLLQLCFLMSKYGTKHISLLFHAVIFTTDDCKRRAVYFPIFITK
jgi:hypothetical protein